MKLTLGDKIRQLRKRDKRKQDDLAKALGVTSQAVSRWESGCCYPDMELIPSIANYFNISIDELFGYDNDRESKIEKIINKINSFGIKSRSDDEWVDECIAILHEGLSEFPQNEKLLITLADTLLEAGWRRYKEWLYYDDEGFIQHDYNLHKSNDYWTEAINICEYLIGNAADNQTVTKAINILVLLYRNIGENEKAINYAQKMPELKSCKELLLIAASDGKEEAGYIGDFLLKTARQFAAQLIYGLITNKHHFDSDMPIEKIKGAISLFHLICDDGNMGIYHGDLIELYLYLSRVQWERGYHDDAFISLDESLNHAIALEAVCDGKEHSFTAPLVSLAKYKTSLSAEIAKALPTDWPMWCHPDYSQVEKEIKSDRRWDKWVKKTQKTVSVNN